MNNASRIALEAMTDANYLLAPEDVDTLLGSLGAFECLTIGVSGGADSTALLVLFDEWRHRANWNGRAYVVTVDHGLRTESAHEAKQVAVLCAKLGLDHSILPWKGEKPSGNLQATARHARYRLIAEHMRERGANALVLAHHLDDQVETFLDRLTRGSGVFGLAAMQEDEGNGPEGLNILRPLLSVRKAALQQVLTDRGIAWQEDRSNSDVAYKRVRLRALLSALEGEGLDASGLAQTAKRLRRARDAMDHWVRTFWASHVVVHPAGPLRIERAAWQELPQEIRLRTLAQAIVIAKGSDYAPRLASLESLEAEILTEPEGRKTLGGTVVNFKDQAIHLWTELGRNGGPDIVQWSSKNTLVWDRRFECKVKSRLEDEGLFLSIGPLSAAPKGPELWEKLGEWPKAAFARSPAIWRGDSLLFVPGLYSKCDFDTQIFDIRPL